MKGKNYQTGKWLAAAIAACFSLTGCSLGTPSRISLSCELPSTNAGTTGNQKSAQLQVEIQVDGTPSMKGYVNADNSRYARTLEALESAATVLSARRKYYKFGIEPRSISKSYYLQAKLPEFYVLEDENFLETRIDAAISEPAKNKINIIVTDLYQQETEIERVTARLSQYLNQNYATGIVAIKSEFKGIIYDVGVAAGRFTYDTEKKSLEEYRPFYLIVSGTYDNVVEYFQQLQFQDEDLFRDEHFIVFHPRIFQEPLLLDKTTRTKGLKRQSTIWIEEGGEKIRINKVNKDEKNIQLLGLKSRRETASMENEAYYSPLPYTLTPATEENTFAIDISAEIFDGKQKDFVPSPQASKLSGKGFKISNWQVEGETMTFLIEVEPKELERTTYYLKVDLTPQEFQEPDWWETWSAGGASQNGAKTNRLRTFLRELKAVTLRSMKSQNAIAGRFCYAIQKN